MPSSAGPRISSINFAVCRQKEGPATAQNHITALVGSLQRFSTEDGPGIRTTIFLKGCPLHCRWCHNPELISFRQQIIRLPNNCIHCGYCLDHCPEKAISVGEDQNIRVDHAKCSLCMECERFCYAKALHGVAKEMTPEEVMDIVEEDKGFYEHTGGGLTLSGGEMLTHADFCEEIIRIAEEKGIAVCLDTSGFGDGDRLYQMASREIVRDILYDMKSIDPEIHLRYTGQSNEPILKNLERLAADPKVNAKITMRMPLVYGVNDTPEQIGKTADFYRRHQLKRVTLLPYHTLGCSKVRNLGGVPEEFAPPGEERLREIQEYFSSLGIAVEILGKDIK